MEKPVRLPFSRISRVKKPVFGVSSLRTILSMSVDLPQPGLPVKRMCLSAFLFSTFNPSS
jgi:hypothetical protein